MSTEREPKMPRGAAAFTALDWIGVALAVLAALALVLVPPLVAPPMVAMFEDFEAELPTITRLVLSGWFAPLLAQLPLVLLVLALVRRHRIGVARLLTVLAFLLGLAGGALVWWGLYAPIFELAGAIEDDPPSASDRVVAIGDLHGDLDATRRALRLAGAIDERDDWAGGELVLVQTGDAIDRGDDDRAVLDLIERLVPQASRAGGALIALNGNHELMNVAGDMRYVTRRACEAFADFPAAANLGHVRAPPFPVRLGGRVTAFAPGGEYALKLARQDVIAIVEDTVFVHGAVLPSHVEYGIERLNREVRQWMRGERTALPAQMEPPDAPIWDRRFSDEAQESDCAELERSLSALGARRMVVGHEAQQHGITSACEGKVWRIDVGLSSFYGGPIEVLEIRGDDVRVLGR